MVASTRRRPSVHGAFIMSDNATAPEQSGSTAFLGFMGCKQLDMAVKRFEISY